jgi:hypothetical protein
MTNKVLQNMIQEADSTREKEEFFSASFKDVDGWSDRLLQRLFIRKRFCSGSKNKLEAERQSHFCG